VIRGIRDISWVSFSLVARQGLGFIGIVVASRLLPTHEFALYMVALAAAVVLIPLADAGMWPLVTRIAARNAAAPLFGLSRRAGSKRLWYWLVIAVALIPPVYLLHRPSGILVALALAGAIGQANLDTTCGELVGRRRYAASAGLRVAASALGLAGMSLLLILGKTAATAMLVFAASRLFLPLLVAAVARPPAFTTSELRWSAGISLGLIAFLQVLYIRSDILMLSAYGVASADIALYGIIYNVLIAMQVIPSAVAITVYPRIAAATQGSWEKLFSLSIGASFAAAIACSALLFVAPSTFFSIFGGGYAADVHTLQALLLVILPLSISQVATAGLQARGREVVLLRLIIGTLMINVSGNAILIPILGAPGAVIATMTAECVLVGGTLLIAGRDLWAFRNVGSFVFVAAAIVLGLLGAPARLISLVLLLALATLMMSNAFGLRDASSYVKARVMRSRQLSMEVR
jgi:O-antigen/teichoic acid export membrane protein